MSVDVSPVSYSDTDSDSGRFEYCFGCHGKLSLVLLDAARQTEPEMVTSLL